MQTDDPEAFKVTGEQYMPHVHDKTAPGGVRAPRADEMPGYMEEY